MERGRLLPLLALAPVLAGPGALHAYSGVADVTFTWGETANPVTWSWRLPNALTVLSNDTLLHVLPGSNQVSYLNSDFASSSGCTAAALGTDGSATAITARKYGCRYQQGNGSLAFLRLPSPPTDTGPAGAQAIGTLYFTDTTLTGQLTVIGTTDEPTGGTLTSVGDGASGFNVRSEDTSVYGNAWYGVSTAAVLTVDLTGTFAPSGWQITGGTVRLSDPGFQCQQGGIGGAAPDFVLCAPTSTLPGSYSSDGSHLSFGVDADGAGVGTTMHEIEVWDAAGTGLVATLSGVLANLAVGPGGVLTTVSGEFRSGRGDGDTCTSKMRWDGTRITCGTLTAGALQISGTATPVDTEPDPFTFSPVTNAALGVTLTSNAVTISGIAAPARITVAGGTYSIGCTGTFTAAAGNIPDGATVCVRHTSAATPGTDTVTTLDIGGIAGTFTSTTLPADTTPDAFAFVDQAGVPAATDVVSAPVTITGINAAAPLAVTNGEYALGCGGSFTTAPGSIAPGQSVCVRHVSAATALTATDTTLTIGGVSDTFTSTTAAPPPDTTPDPFGFAGQADVPLAAVSTSQAAVITGLTAAAPVSVVNGEYSVGCTAAFTAAAGLVLNDDAVCVRHTSATTNSTPVTTTLTIGGVAGTFTSTTVAAVPPDTTPDAFTFADQAGVPLATTVTSAPVGIAGITAPASVTVTGGSYSVGCTGAYTAVAGTIANGQTVCVRHTSAAGYSTTVTTTLAVGGVSDTFSSTTVASPPPPDTTPDAFSFVDQAGVALSTVVVSPPVAITGIDAPAAVAVTGGEYSLGCTGAYTAAAGTITNGQTVCVRHTSAAANNATTITVLTVGAAGAGTARSDDFRSTTVGASGGGGGGGAVDLLLLGLLTGLLRRRRRD